MGAAIGKYYTYIIGSLKDGSYYIGSCDDLDCRISKHNDGQSKYTGAKTPWQLSYFEVFETRSEAIKREYGVKK